MNDPEIWRWAIALVTPIAFVAWGTLWTLWSLSTGRALDAGDTLYALCTLWTGRTLRPGIALGTGIFPAGRERK